MHPNYRPGLSTIVTAMIMLSAVSILGTAALVLSNQNFTLFKSITDESIPNTNVVNQNQESMIIENPVYHSSTGQFNFTLTNTGFATINVTKIEIDSPSVNVTSVLSNSITNTESLTNVPVYSKPGYSKILTMSTLSPSSMIPPGQSFTTGITYTSFTDPITITVTTSNGAIYKTQVEPNVNWYDTHWQFRKRITLNYTQIVGNPEPIQLDGMQNTTGSGKTITLPNFVVGSGSNRLLLVAVESNTGNVNTTGLTMTYGGITLTRANQTNTNTIDSEIWYLVNPPIGSANIVAHMSTSSANVIMGAYSFFGVDQTFPIPFSANKTSTAVSSGSVTDYRTTPNSWIVDSMAVQNNPSTFTQNSAQTVGWNKGTSTVTGGSSRVLTSIPPIPQTMSWSWTGNQNYAAVAVEIKASAFYNFPLLINETTDTDLKNNAQSNGNDILFTLSDGKTKLDHEIENYTSTTGSLTAWVQVPNIYNSPNNVFYMYYGNSAATNQQNIASTWDPTYAGVWHFAGNPPPTGTSPVIDNHVMNFTNQTTLQVQHIIEDFTVGGYNSRLLVVGAATDNPSKFSSITYGGTPLTQLPHQLFNTDSELWYLVNPPIGTADILATLTGGANVATLDGYSIHGVDQTTPVAPVAAVNAGTSQTAMVNVTNIWPNSLLIDEVSVGYGAQAGCCVFYHPHWDLEQPTQTEEGPHATDINHVTTATSVSFPTAACTTTKFRWTVYSSNSDQWTDAAVEVKSNSSNGDTTVQDSTSNQNFFSPINLPFCGQVSGKIGGGTSLNGVNQFFTRNTTLIGMPAINGPQTASIWFSTPSSNRGSFPQDLFSLQNSSGIYGTKAIKMGFQRSNGIDTWKYSPTTNIENYSVSSLLGNWHYAVYTYNKTQSSLYIDGVRKNATTVAPPISMPANFLYVGASSTTNNPASMTEFFNGKVDEFRISTTVRSVSWIATEYNNQAFPNIFYTVGPPQKVTDIRSSQ
jgi:hypothetical protein